MNENGITGIFSTSTHSVQEMDFLPGEPNAGNPWNTPLRKDAFAMSEEEKIRVIALHFREIMNVLGLDLTDESLAGTPRRVAHMYVKEIFGGLDPGKKPAITLFENGYGYDHMLVEMDIRFNSTCEHHLVPILGNAHVGYFSSGKIIGLSKINRIVQYYAARPQVQERLTVQVANELAGVVGTEDVAVVLEASHLCVAARGIKDSQSKTVTARYGGRFNDPGTKAEFLKYIKSKA